MLDAVKLEAPRSEQLDFSPDQLLTSRRETKDESCLSPKSAGGWLVNCPLAAAIFARRQPLPERELPFSTQFLREMTDPAVTLRSGRWIMPLFGR